MRIAPAAGCQKPAGDGDPAHQEREISSVQLNGSLSARVMTPSSHDREKRDGQPDASHRMDRSRQIELDTCLRLKCRCYPSGEPLPHFA